MDVYQEVTDRIVAELESGRVPWHKPWSVETGQPRSIDGRPYRGINALLLGMSPFEDPRWGTYRAIGKHGGQVRRGERSTTVVLWKPYDKRDKDTGEKSRGLMLRYFNVFNVAQADWTEPLEPLAKIEPLAPDAIFDVADEVITGYVDRPTIGYGGDHAYYREAEDRVQLPPREAFTSSKAYATTLFHELTHSTGAAKRLNRDDLVGHAGFGSQPYSREELVAEMGAAMIAATVGVEPEYEQSAAYIRSWLKALQDDKRLVVSAAARSQKAADLILGNTPKVESEA